MHAGEILDADELRSATRLLDVLPAGGGRGRADTRGMFRVHQFNKVEMFVFTRPEDSRDEHERMIALEEELARRSASPTAPSTSPPATSSASAAEDVRPRDVVPDQGRYREVTSCSNTTDFQARRLGIRWRSPRRPRAAPHAERDGRHRPHLLAILENFQGDVPDVLQPLRGP